MSNIEKSPQFGLDESDPQTAVPASSPTTIDGTPIRDPVIVTENQGKVVLWQVDLLGHPTGAWTLLEEGTEAARTLLSICDQRGLIALHPVPPLESIERWAHTAGLPLDRESLRTRLCSVTTLLQEAASARTKYTSALHDSEKRDGKRRAPLAWNKEIPDPIPSSIEDFVAATGFRTRPTSTNDTHVDTAKFLAYLTKWALDVWADTETVPRRRPYLRQTLGPAQPAPPSWRSALRSAHENPFELG